MVNLFLVVSLIIGRKFYNKNLIGFIFGFVLFEFILNFLPATYDLLAYNYHDATFIYIMLSMLLGIVFMKFFEVFKCDTNVVWFSTIFLILGFLLFLKGGLISLIIYSIFGFVVSMYFHKKNILCLILFYVLGLILGNIKVWVIGYVLGFALGIVFYNIADLILIVIKKSGKSNSFLLLMGMILSFIGSLFK